jgi:hypothetical protein
MGSGEAMTPRPLRALARCATCCHFVDDAREIERQLAGLITLSSAYAAVRAADGLCSVHDRYLAAASGCTAWRGREESPPVDAALSAVSAPG